MTATTEYLIQGDQIVARDTFIRPVTNVADVMKELSNQSNYVFSEVSLPPLLSKWTKSHYLGVDTNSSVQRLLSEVEYFPLPNAYVRSSGKISFQYTSDDTPETKKPLVSQKWEFPSNYRTFIIQFFDKARPTDASPLSIQKPILFLLKDNETPLVPKLPNLFSCGNICAGPSYHGRTKDMHNDALHAFKVGLDTLHTATPNFDLNQSATLSYVRYESMYNQVPLYPDTAQMYRSATKYSIVKISEWIIHNKI